MECQNNLDIVEKDLRLACEALERGEVILYPTDTVWGIGCDATDPEAVRRVYDIKHRSDSKALIVLVGSLDMLGQYVDRIPDEAYKFMADERPTTMVLDGGKGLAPNLLADDGSVGMRVTSETFSKSLCLMFGRPIVSTSANVSGMPAPSVYSEISSDILDAVDYVAVTRRGDTGKSMPSRIVKIDLNGNIQIIRS